MRKKQAGQAFVMVLILLGIGALLVVPSLRLTGTSLKSSQVVEKQIKGLYAADAAQEYILWKLLYAGFGGEFFEDGDTIKYNFDVCDVPVGVAIVMRATEGEGGTTLATDDLIKPTKTVAPSEVSDGSSRTYTYIINLEQISEDNSQGLDAVYDVLSKGLDYVVGSSRLRVDGGEWGYFPDPSIYTTGGQQRLRWPYSDSYSDYFTSPMRDFAVRQVKEISFEVTGSLLPNRMYYNWVLLKLGDINTFSGPQAPITVGAGTNPEGGLLEASKTSNPTIIQPGVETDIEYTITITNLDDETHQIQEITDYLPPGFEYLGPTSGITEEPPQGTEQKVIINDIERYCLLWQFSPAVPIESGGTLTMTFWATATKDVSGSYYNEFTVVPNTPIPGIFQPDDMNVTYADFNATYSWNTGAVIVPAYDSSSDAEGITINSNMSLILGGITITSWQVD